MIYIKNTKGIHVKVNRAYPSFMKKPRREIVGRTDYELFEKELADKIRKDEEKVLEGYTINSVYEWIGKTVNFVKSPIRDNLGRLKHILAIGRDISLIKRLKASLL